jgi:hypothetical protein
VTTTLSGANTIVLALHANDVNLGTVWAPAQALKSVP